MIYLILFDYTDPTTGKTYHMKGIKDGRDKAEAVYYFSRRYPRHKINITEVKAI